MLPPPFVVDVVLGAVVVVVVVGVPGGSVTPGGSVMTPGGSVKCGNGIPPGKVWETGMRTRLSVAPRPVEPIATAPAKPNMTTNNRNFGMVRPPRGNAFIPSNAPKLVL